MTRIKCVPGNEGLCERNLGQAFSAVFIYNLFSAAYMRNSCDLLLLGKHVALDGELGAEETQTSFPNLSRVNLTFQLEGGWKHFVA